MQATVNKAVLKAEKRPEKIKNFGDTSLRNQINLLFRSPKLSGYI